MTLQEAIADARIRMNNKLPDYSLIAFMLRDHLDRDNPLWDLAFELGSPRSGYCSRADLEGLIELMEEEIVSQ
jgi:hypothetical protein